MKDLVLTRQLNDQRTVEDLLQPAVWERTVRDRCPGVHSHHVYSRSEREGNLVTHVHRSTRRSTTSVQVERLPLLETIKNEVQVPVRRETDISHKLFVWGSQACVHGLPMRKEGFTTQKTMRSVSSQTFEPLQQCGIDPTSPEGFDELVVIADYRRGSAR